MMAMERRKIIGVSKARKGMEIMCDLSIALSISRCPFAAYTQITRSIRSVATCSEA